MTVGVCVCLCGNEQQRWVAAVVQVLLDDMRVSLRVSSRHCKTNMIVNGWCTTHTYIHTGTGLAAGWFLLLPL